MARAPLRHGARAPRRLKLPRCVPAQAEALGLKAPTEIQSAVIPAILEGGHVVMASHTGSGKTLAFLLPLVRGRGAQSPPGWRLAAAAAHAPRARAGARHPRA